MMNTREVADYLGIHEKQVYALIKAGKIPCTRVTGKWVFPKHLIDEWIDSNAHESGPELIKGKNKRREGMDSLLLAAGSNDPILDILLDNMQMDHPEFKIFSSSTGSTEGLRMLGDEIIDVAFCHLLDPQTGEYNIPYINSYIPDRKIAVIHLFYRDIGFVSAPGSAVTVKSFKDLVKDDVRFINRQAGSGTRVLLDYNLESKGVNSSDIKGYENEVTTHFEVGLSILSGQADTGIATVAVSKLFGLPFVPIKSESFDMVLLQSTFFDRGVQAFIEKLKSDEFRIKVKPLGDYDFTESGKIIHSTA